MVLLDRHMHGDMHGDMHRLLNHNHLLNHHRLLNNQDLLMPMHKVALLLMNMNGFGVMDWDHTNGLGVMNGLGMVQGRQGLRVVVTMDGWGEAPQLASKVSSHGNVICSTAAAAGTVACTAAGSSRGSRQQQRQQ
jgi:hypothetical protein